MKKRPKVIVVMPAYYAAKTLEKTFHDIPHEIVSEIILVDDASADQTVHKAKQLGIKTFVHTQNVGYGGNQKTCYWEALKRNPDIIVMLHPDYQYDGSLTPQLIQPIIDGRYDIMIGSRIRNRKETLAGGMPLIKYIGNRTITLIENIILGLNLSEHLSGFRAYSREVLATVPYSRFSNDFVFDQQFIISAISYGFKIGEIPVPVRYFKEASSIKGLRGIKYVVETFYTLALYVLHSSKILSVALFNQHKATP